MNARLSEAVRRIEIVATRLVDEQFGGQYESLFKGRGIEFSENREYQPGDDVRDIDWNVTARMGRPFVKKNVEERELSLLLVVDVSPSQEFGSQQRTKRELAGELGAVLALAALRNNDRAGLLLFGNQVEKYIPPRKGRRHVLRLVREILEPTRESVGGQGTDLAGALTHLSRVHQRRAVVFVLSDFLASPFSRELRLATRKFDLSAFRLFDPREEDIPAVGRVRLRDLETGEHLVLNTSCRRFQKEHREHMELVRNTLHGGFRAAGVDFTEFSTAEPMVAKLVRFFATRRDRARRRRRAVAS